MSTRVSGWLERWGGCVSFLAAVPIIAGSAIIVALLSKRSPFVAHLRVGQHGGALWMLKLRTMWNPRPALPCERGWVERIIAEPCAEPSAKPALDRKTPDDARVSSRFAAFCRRHSIDELPQLLHVARGEMALVGPRPLTAGELAKHYGARIPCLLSVKPGLTGLWQTQGRSALNWQARVVLDLEQVQRRSARRYAAILYRTLPALITGKGAW